MICLHTEAGLVELSRARDGDYDTVMAVLREAADWLSGRGNPQWRHWHMEVGEWMLRNRIAHHEVYTARLNSTPIGTLTIQWQDAETWAERGLDGEAGYIHGIAIVRRVGGRRVGERLLEWAVETISERGRKFARLDCVASNERLCPYYERHGFRRVGITPPLPGDYIAQLFERESGTQEKG